jgi:hypothetical protein
MQIPILNGMYTDTKADFRSAYPINMKPIVKETGVSKGYLRPVEGITQLGTGPGRSRGAINWDGQHYRVMGSRIVRILPNNVVSDLGGVFDDGKQVSLAYSFDRLAIASGEKLYYLQNDTLTEATDPDFGRVLDVIWIDGYFMFTDGQFISVAELNDPLSVNPLKYTSSEIDPDPIVALIKHRNEVYAVNRYTIELFRNVGGSNFPFARVNGAQIQRGALGTHCVTVYEEQIALLGSAPGESPGVYLAANGSSQKISTREIDEILSSYTEAELADVVLEVVNDRSHALLWVRLPDRTLVFDLQSTSVMGEAVWYVMSSGPADQLSAYRGIDVIWCYDDWQCGDLQSSAFGVLTDDVATQFGDHVAWQFGTSFIYNEGRGATVHSIELVALVGRVAFGEDPVIETSYSLDGRNWSQRRPIRIGMLGDRLKRIIWRRQGNMRHLRIQRFTGDTRAYMAIARLEVDMEPLGA